MIDEDEHPEFNAEIDTTLREYRGPGIYKHTGERIAPIQQSYEHRGPIYLRWVRSKIEYILWIAKEKDES